MARAGLTRDIIIAAAAELVDEHGFEALTLAQVAKRFGVRLASLYSHLTSSDDLRRGVATLALSRLADSAEQALAGRAGADALRAFADTHREFARQHPGLFAATRFRLSAESAAASGGARLSRAAAAMLRGYDLTEADRVHATRLIGAFMLGFSQLELAGSFDHSAPEPGTSWDRGLEALDALIRSWRRQSA